MRAARVVGAVGLGVLLTGAGSVVGQSTVRPLPSGLAIHGEGPFGFGADALRAPVTVTQSREGADPVRPAALSLLVPGLGQRALGQWRGWVYLSLEAIGWTLYANRRRAAADYRRRYRDFAWEVARLQTGSRVDPAFPYYESMSHWERSGSFDSDSQVDGVQPEPDAATYNGAIWERAVGLYLGGSPGEPTDPAYDAALAYYTERAWGADFLWDWSGTGSAMAEFAGLIESSDHRSSQATHVLGGVVANHLVAAVDAYLSARGSPASVELRAAPPPAAGHPRWEARVSWRLPR